MQILPIFFACTEALVNNTLYLLWATLTVYVLVCFSFYLGLIYPSSIGQRICNFVKKNASLFVQKTCWKKLLYLYCGFEVINIDSKKKGYVFSKLMIGGMKSKTFADVSSNVVAGILVKFGTVVTGVQMMGLDQVAQHEVEYLYNKFLNPEYKFPLFIMKEPNYIVRLIFSW